MADGTKHRLYPGRTTNTYVKAISVSHNFLYTLVNARRVALKEKRKIRKWGKISIRIKTA
jgi:hypothetical protein